MRKHNKYYIQQNKWEKFVLGGFRMLKKQRNCSKQFLFCLFIKITVKNSFKNSKFMYGRYKR